MNEKKLLERITFDKEILGGKAIIRGLRISANTVLELLAKGASSEEILEDYPELETEDIQAVLLYTYQIVNLKETNWKIKTFL